MSDITISFGDSFATFFSSLFNLLSQVLFSVFSTVSGIFESGINISLL